jgi:hypothetical protein
MKKSELQQIIREEVNQLTSPAARLSTAIDKAMHNIDASMSYKDFAMAIAQAFQKAEYGSHNLKPFLRELVKHMNANASAPVREARNAFQVTDFPAGSKILFNDGEEWIVVEKGMRGSGTQRKSDEITIRPFNKLAKDKNVSLAIDVNLEFLNANVKEINESEVNINEAARVPSNVMDFAKRKGSYATALVKKAATWAEKAGKRISGGTAIGKNYSTIVLDMEHHGSEIYISLDKETIELFGEEVTDAKSFARVLAANTK